MVKTKKPRTKKTKSRSEKNIQERYSIDLNIHDKDMALMVSDRRCYMCCKLQKMKVHILILILY